MSSGTISLPCLISDWRKRGWQAWYHSSSGPSASKGRVASVSRAYLARAYMKSKVPRRSKAASISSISGRMVSAKAVNMRTISRRSSMVSSRSRLFASTTSAGSMKNVLPEPDSPCTIPEILRLYIGATGMTRRPSRTDGVVSASR